jgi:hypothetical protein
MGRGKAVGEDQIQQQEMSRRLFALYLQMTTDEREQFWKEYSGLRFNPELASGDFEKNR